MLCSRHTPAIAPGGSHSRRVASKRSVLAAAKGGGGKGGGKPKGGGGSTKKPAPGFGPPPSKKANTGDRPSFISAPIAVELQDELTKTEFAENPRWDTFCNHMSGEWVGQYSAYTPWEALPEPVWKDERGKYVDWVYSRCIEYPGQIGSGSPEQEDSGASSSSSEGPRQSAAGAGDAAQHGAAGPDALSGKSAREVALTGGVDQVLVRRLTRDFSLQRLSNFKLRPIEGQALSDQEDREERQQEKGTSLNEDSVDVEALSNNTNGVVFFNGGTYSAGPDFIGPPSYKILQDVGTSDSEEEQGAGQHSSTSREGGASSSGRPPDSGAGNRKGKGDDEGGEGEGMLLAEPGSISIFESCLVDWSSKSRVRLKVTLRIRHIPDNGEVDLEVMRVLLFREFWAGIVGQTSQDDIKATLQEAGADKVPCTDLPRPTRNGLHGSWAVFTTSALAIEDSNPFTGEPMISWAYMTNEDRQLWQVPRGPPSEQDDAGAALWLPGGVVASLRMVDLSAQESSSESEDGSTSGAAMFEGDPQEEAARLQHHQPSAGGLRSDGSSSGTGAAANGAAANGAPGPRPARGFSFGLSWCLPSGSGSGAALQVCSVERDYDGAGMLRGVRSLTAVKGGWSGGKM